MIVASSSQVRAFLVLGRVSNLPTVWSNCLAAWLISGAEEWGRWWLVCLSATLLYTGGMFLNDACDVHFDRQYRPERPIPSGSISERAVWAMATVLLGAGWLAIIPLGGKPLLVASLLLAAIVVYDYVHKRVRSAPWLMAGCRFLLYLLAGAAAARQIEAEVIPPATALAIYVLGISYLARGESTGGLCPRWPVLLLVVPLFVAVLAPSGRGVHWTLIALLGGWLIWCLWGRNGRHSSRHASGVAGLLAGIVLVDWLAAGALGQMAGVFAGLFLFALLLQRIAPAT